MSHTSRPSFIENTITIVAAGFFANRLYAKSATPPETIGPFYPVIPPKDQDFHLTNVDGRNGFAKGKIIYLQGRILNSNHQSIENAAIDLW